MNRPFPLLVLCLACAGPRSTAVEPEIVEDLLLGRTEPRLLPDYNPELDALHYRIEIALYPQAQRIEGRTTIRARIMREGLRYASFDLMGLRVRAVWSERGAPLAFAQGPGGLRVDLAHEGRSGEEIQVLIETEGSPDRGLYFAPGENPTHCFTQGECEDARRWFPCLDHPSDRAQSELVVDMPAGWTSMAGGVRTRRTPWGDRVREHWEHLSLHPAYLETLVAGELSVVEEAGTVPISFVAPQEQAELLQASLGQTRVVLEYLGSLTGRAYPYPKYATCAVDGFPFGGMENTSATTITLDALCDERALADGGPEGLIVHEAAHQWFGDLLTCADWHEIWLNEGFATYCTLLWYESTRGSEDFGLRIFDLMEGVAKSEEKADRAIVHGACRDPLDLFFSGHAYQGGAARLHHLRSVLGDEPFFAGIRRYVEQHADSAVTSDDLRQSLELAAGVDLTRHFADWLHSPGLPRFELKQRYDEGRQLLRVTLSQTQAEGNGRPRAFQTPATIEWKAGGEIHRERVRIEARTTTFEFACPAPPIWVRFDPARAIPCERVENHSLPSLMALAATAPDAQGRVQGIRGLADQWDQLDAPLRREVLDVLVRRAAADPEERVRLEVCQALGRTRTAAARGILLAMLEAETTLSERSSALSALEAFAPDTTLYEHARRAFARSASWDEAGAALRLAARCHPTEARRFLEELIVAPGRLEVDDFSGRLAAHLAQATRSLSSADRVALLSPWLSDALAPARARLAALEALEEDLPRTPSLREACEGLVGDRDSRISRAAVLALVRIGDPRAQELLRDYYPRTACPRERRAIESLFKVE